MIIDPQAPLETEWDAIVIGAGPAGAVVARALALNGVHTLLVEAKDFPRRKTCGGCLNSRAVAALQGAGLGETLERCQPRPINRLDLYWRGGSLRTPLPEGRSVSRETLDSALVDAAVQAGVTVRMSTTARVGSCEAGWRSVSIAGPTRAPQFLRARVVVACDGLGHPSLRDFPEFQTMVSPGSRIGVGAILEGAPDLLEQCPIGAISMAVGRLGYVGLARCERDRLSVAAALDPQRTQQRSTSAAICATLAEAGLTGFEIPPDTPWRGVPRLTQRSAQIAGERLLLVGDAAGYVEPFTGEGMAAAIVGALEAAPWAAEGVPNWRDSTAWGWAETHRRQVRSRELICKGLAWLLRRPTLLRVGFAIAAKMPFVAKATAAQIAAAEPPIQNLPSRNQSPWVRQSQDLESQCPSTTSFKKTRQSNRSQPALTPKGKGG